MIPLFKPFIALGAGTRVQKVLDSSYIGQGPVVEEFEAELAKRLGTANVLTVNSGTAALELALACLNIGQGDEVISTPMTCSATNHCINNTGASIIWADIDAKSGLISAESVTKAITPATKAIVLVDWGGERVPLELGLLRREMPIIIDSAHRAPSVDNRYRDAGRVFIAYSFQAIKFLTTGDGGMLQVPREYYDEAKLARWFGLDRESASDFRCSQSISIKGHKWHMNDIAAAIGIANLEGLDARVARHKMVAYLYAGQGIVPRNHDSHHWVAFLHVNARADFQKYMADKNISTSLVHSRNDGHPVFGKSAKNLPGVDAFAKTYCAIPCGWWLTDAEVEHIASSVLAWEKEHGRPE